MRPIEVGEVWENPVTLEHAYTMPPAYFNWRPDLRNQEFICEENNRNGVDEHGITTAK